MSEKFPTVLFKITQSKNSGLIVFIGENGKEKPHSGALLSYVKWCVVYSNLNQPELWLDRAEDLRESQPLPGMSYVPEITTAKRRPLIHAEAVALFNDTWQILCQGESKPAWQLTAAAALPQSIPSLLVSLSPSKTCNVYLGRSSNSAASVYWSQVDYENKQNPDGWQQFQTCNSQVWGSYWQQGLRSIRPRITSLFLFFAQTWGVPTEGRALCKQGRCSLTCQVCASLNESGRKEMAICTSDHHLHLYYKITSWSGALQWLC